MESILFHFIVSFFYLNLYFRLAFYNFFFHCSFELSFSYVIHITHLLIVLVVAKNSNASDWNKKYFATHLSLFQVFS